MTSTTCLKIFTFLLYRQMIPEMLEAACWQVLQLPAALQFESSRDFVHDREPAMSTLFYGPLLRIMVLFSRMLPQEVEYLAYQAEALSMLVTLPLSNCRFLR